MPELFEFPPTRSNRAKWALEELGIDYISRKVDLITGQQQSADHKAIHPLGHVPAFRTDEFTMHESVAIVMHLIDQHPESGLAPPIGTPERAEYYQWCVFSSAELDHILSDIMKHTMHLAEEERIPKIADKAKQLFNDRAEILSTVLQTRPFLLGPTFSGADIAIGYDCNWAAYTGMLDSHPTLTAYYARLQSRPAFKKVFAI